MTRDKIDLRNPIFNDENSAANTSKACFGRRVRALVVLWRHE